MQRKTGSLMELFTCRNCKKRRHIRPSKDSAPGANVTHKNAPQPRPSIDANENAPTIATTEASSVEEEDEQWQTTVAERARNRKDLEPSSKSFFYDIGIPQFAALPFDITPESPHSILKNPDSPPNRQKSRHASVSERRARFKEAVDVIVHDNHGNAIVMDRVKLKAAADDDCNSARPPPGECDSKHLCDDRASSALARRRSVFSMRSMRVEVDGSGRKSLRLIVALGEAFSERTIHVCTARGGSRILVGAYRPEPLGDGTNYLRQYIDRFHLPHPVDALSIHAELDPRSGELVITAPLFDFDAETIDAGRPNSPINKRTYSI
jgi:hypothetical protein